MKYADLKVELMSANECLEYHNILMKDESDRTKEDIYNLNKLVKASHRNGLKVALVNLVNNSMFDDTVSKVNILEYENMPSMYRIQVLIKGKYKTVARIKASFKDVHVAIREETAKAINKDYVIVNYNLPAQFNVSHNEIYKVLESVVNYHYNEQKA